MFQWATRSEGSEAEAAHGAIEMKGSEPKPQPPRRQWKGIWPAWEETKSASKMSGTQSKATQTGDSSRTPCGPPALRASSFSSAATSARLANTENVTSSGLQSAEAIITPLQSGNDPADDADFYEVKMVIKVPKPAKATDAQHQIHLEEVRRELEQTRQECQKALRALDSRSRECEDLVALVRELTESRSQLTAFKAVQTERFEDLQQEYVRVLRVAELSRAISKENLAKTAETMRKLNQVEEELARQRLIAQQTKDRLARQKLDNLDMKERLSMLERLDLLAFRRDSACLVNFQQLSLKETY